MKKLVVLFLLTASFTATAQPKISFTFDDGSLADRPGYPFKIWNNMLLDNLDKAGVKSIFFVTGNNKTNEKGKYLLKSWNDRGHRIGNHTVNHPNYNSPNVSFEDFKKEFLSNDSIIRQYSNYISLFRFPYLKEGNTEVKVTNFRELMKQHHYKNGYVTIDASDWYIDSRLVKRLHENQNADIEGYKKYYLEHLLEHATYYENIAYRLTGRHISHNLLLHHNLAAALFLDDLIKMFKENGWEVISAEEAFTDEIYNEIPEVAGESLIWALARQSGKFDDILRYPAEDSQYEKEKMDKLGL